MGRTRFGWVYPFGILKTGAGINKEDAITPTIIEKNGIKFEEITVINTYRINP
jgi:hypothetical protein